jgi:anthranilate synthase component 2
VSTRLLLIDNYDSFTYNLVHYLEMNDGVVVDVVRNDALNISLPSTYDRIVLSPGPGLPSEAGLLMEVIRCYAAKKPILGVCLGLQAMAEVYGGTLHNLDEVLHGVARRVFVTDAEDPLFKGLPAEFMGGRYHSWVADRNSLPSCFRVTATDEQQNIMALRHKEYDLCGVQFHPESVLTEFGQRIIANWVEDGALRRKDAK